jgi:hypothetical protein
MHVNGGFRADDPESWAICGLTNRRADTPTKGSCTMTHTPRRRIAALIAATNRQPTAGLLTALAYLMAATGMCGFVLAVISLLAHL